MFLGRRRELGQLNALFDERKFQLFILYGRRRVGKTALLKEFCRDKESIFYSAQLSNDKMNRDKFSALVLQYYHSTDLHSFPAWENAFAFIAERQRDKRLVLVLDEFPYLAEKNPALLSSLQHIIDHTLTNSQIFLILCGSYLGFMEREVLGAKSPLYGRRTAQLQLKPFDYWESCEFLTGFTPEEQCMFYGALGGVPQYLAAVEPQKNFAENMERLFLRPMGLLYEEPLFLLREEIQQPGIYNAVLSAIAGGATKANEIAGKTGEPVAKCLKYIQLLINLGLVCKETPFGEKESSRRSVYRLDDALFRFWYRYVLGGKTLIDSAAGKLLWAKQIEPNYSEYMGLTFEKICREYLLRQNSQGNLPFLFTGLGRWWGTDARTKQQTEIDLVATDNNNYLLAECKWRNEKTDSRVLADLREKAAAYGKNSAPTWLALFAKSGFTDAVWQEAAHDKKLLLFDLPAIFGDSVTRF